MKAEGFNECDFSFSVCDSYQPFFWYIQYYSDLLQYKSLEELKAALISILTNSFNHFIKPVDFTVEFLKAFEYFVH